MGTGIVSIGDADALGIVAEGGERGGEEQGKDGLGCGFNLGLGAAEAKKCVDGPGLRIIFKTGIAGVGAVFDRGFEIEEGKERVIVQLVGVVKAIHCEADVAGVGDDDVIGDCPEFFQLIKIVMFNNEANIKPGVGVRFGEMVHFGFCFPNFIFEIAVGEDDGVEGFHFTALCRDKLGQAGEDAGRVILPGSGVMALVIFHDNHCGFSFQSESEKDCGAFIESLAEGIGKHFEVGRAFIGERGIYGAASKGFKLAAGDGAGIGQLGEFDEGIGGGLGLVEGEGIQHFGLDLGITHGFNMFIREGRYHDCAVGDGVRNDAGGTKIRDGFQNGEVTDAGCGFIVDRKPCRFRVREVINRPNTQVYIVRGVLFDGGAAGVQHIHCGVGKTLEAFDRLGFIFQPGAGTLAGLTGSRTGVEIANDGREVKGIGEGESVKRVNHFWDFLSAAQAFRTAVSIHNSIFNSACLDF